MGALGTKSARSLLMGGVLALLLALVLAAGLASPAAAAATDRIAFSNYFDIFTADPDGSDMVRLTDVSSYSDEEPVWSPDGRKIAFVRHASSTSLWVMNADGTDQKQLTDLGTDANCCRNIAWTPDGSKIGFFQRSSPQRFMTINADGTGLSELNALNGLGAYSVSWSPDGTRLAFSLMNADLDNNGVRWEAGIYTASASGTAVEEVVTGSPSSTPSTFYRVKWSPDGSRLAFDALANADLTAYTVNEDGTGLSQISDVEGGEYSITWSPDGSRVAYVAQYHGGGCPSPTRCLYTANADGTNPVHVPNPGSSSGDFYQHPSWHGSPQDDRAPLVQRVLPDSVGTVQTNVTAWFDEALDPTTVNASTVSLAKAGSTTQIPAAVSYDGPLIIDYSQRERRTAVLNPNADLEYDTTYNVTIEGGPSGVKDRAGNPLAVDKTWSFTTYPPPDTQAPTVSLTAPADGATVSGTAVTLSADATDDKGVAGVDFYVGAQKVGSDASAPYAVSWNSTTVADGGYAVTARARDAAGNEGASAARTVTVRNAPAGPPNDRFADAQSLSGADASAEGSNAGATKEAGEPNHAGNAGGGSVWYEWTAPAGGQVALTTAGSSFDTLLGVYTGGSVGSLAEVASNDDADGSGVRHSGVAFNATAGTTYRVAVDGFGGDSGDVSLSLSQEPADAQAPTVASSTPVPDKTGVRRGSNVSVTFSEAMKAGTLDRSNVALYKNGAGSPVSAAVTAGAGNASAKLDPSSRLAARTRYMVVLWRDSAESGVQDEAGNLLRGSGKYALSADGRYVYFWFKTGRR